MERGQIRLTQSVAPPETGLINYSLQLQNLLTRLYRDGLRPLLSARADPQQPVPACLRIHLYYRRQPGFCGCNRILTDI
ncbi:hypothetical protein D3C73_1280060 [compost metagenome]